MCRPPLLRAAIPAPKISEVMQKHFPQPVQQFRFGVAVKAIKVAMGLKKGLLNQVGCAALGAQIGIELASGNE